ncbi:hypothetical protein SNE40_006937 [Patella caerulea]|uniref:Thioredoxin-like fold domain-containing protein n=1 Tax=Patella caerulea TaxID=87958 RepID=A0AAN8PWT5_PATCE
MLILLLVSFLSLVPDAATAVPLPNRPLGFVYNCSCDNAPIKLSLFLEMLCPYSERSDQMLRQVADYYGPERVQLTYHLFPLPYHIHSFSASKAVHIVDLETSGLKTFAFMTHMLTHRDQLSTGNTMNITTDTAIRRMATSAERYGVTFSRFMSLMSNSDVEHITRVGWKYACTRRVTGTPIHFINDIRRGESSWTLQQWKDVIDPLLNDSTVFSNRTMIPSKCVRPANRMCRHSNTPPEPPRPDQTSTNEPSVNRQTTTKPTGGSERNYLNYILLIMIPIVTLFK